MHGTRSSSPYHISHLPFPADSFLLASTGRSNALNIAERLGLDGRIIEEARTLHGEANLEASEVSALGRQHIRICRLTPSFEPATRHECRNRSFNFLLRVPRHNMIQPIQT